METRPQSKALLLAVAWLLAHHAKSCLAVDPKDLYVYDLLIKLNTICDLVGEVTQDMTHKIGHLDTTRHSLNEADAALKTISVQALTLTTATVEQIKENVVSGRLNIKEVQEHIDDLSQLTDGVEKLKAVEKELVKLIIRIEEEHASHDETKHTAVLQQQIAKLAAELKQQQEKDKTRQLPYDVIEAIQSKDFRTADNTMNLIAEDSKITLIVTTVYDHNVLNLPVLMGFTKFLTNRTKTLLMLKAVRSQLIDDRHEDTRKVLELLKVADSIQANSVESSEKENVEELKKDLRSSVVSKVKEDLKTALREDKQGQGEIKDLLRDIYDYQNDMFKDALKLAMDDAYLDITTDRWLDLTRALPYIEQMIITCVSVWEKMHQHEEMNRVAVTDVGFTVRETLEQGNYGNVGEALRKQLEKIKEELPMSVKNAVFANQVCLKNVKYGEYLYAPIDGFKYDEDRRNVFTWGSGARVGGGAWRVERDGNRYYFKNLEYNEYLYAANDHFNKFHRSRSVFTWARGGRVINGVWWIEPDGEECYIKITENNEYFIAGDDKKKWNTDRRRVFTAIGGGKPEEAKWIIEEC